ncbi:hypothetical protein CF326_g339 [Tilletia indica]|nr:hypothetical protein CF326_g339 [Tilletia indica]
MARHSDRIAARLRKESLRSPRQAKVSSKSSKAGRDNTKENSEQSENHSLARKKSHLGPSSSSAVETSAGRQAQTVWTPEETKCLLDALHRYAHLRAKGKVGRYIYSYILARHGSNGTKTQTLRGKTPAQLSSKARVELQRRYREKIAMPYWQPILFSKFSRRYIWRLGKEINFSVEEMPADLDESSVDEDHSNNDDNSAHEEEGSSDCGMIPPGPTHSGENAVCERPKEDNDKDSDGEIEEYDEDFDTSGSPSLAKVLHILNQAGFFS